MMRAASSIKSEYKDATHNVPVMVVGEKQKRDTMV